jgi:acyl-CoA dehydrogenase
MRSIGAAERALELMVEARSSPAKAFGKPFDLPGQEHGGDRAGPDRGRGDAADGAAPRRRRWTSLGNAEARVWVSAVKAMVPDPKCCQIVDEAIQVHGAAGVSQWFAARPACGAAQRTLRLADGPDEVHWHVVGRAEISSMGEAAAGYDPKRDHYARLESHEGADHSGIFAGP